MQLYFRFIFRYKSAYLFPVFRFLDLCYRKGLYTSNRGAATKKKDRDTGDLLIKLTQSPIAKATCRYHKVHKWHPDEEGQPADQEGSHQETERTKL